jgi:hypothetical protein
MRGQQRRGSKGSRSQSKGRKRTKRDEEGRFAPSDRPRTGGRRGSSGTPRGQGVQQRDPEGRFYSESRGEPSRGWTWNDDRRHDADRGYGSDDRERGPMRGYGHDQQTTGMQYGSRRGGLRGYDEVGYGEGRGRDEGERYESREGMGRCRGQGGYEEQYRQYSDDRYRSRDDEPYQRWHGQADNDDRERGYASMNNERPRDGYRRGEGRDEWRPGERDSRYERGGQRDDYRGGYVSRYRYDR